MENFNESQQLFSFFTKSKKERKEDKEIYQTEKVGSALLPAPESVLPTLNTDAAIKNVVIASGKSVQEGKDFGVGVTKKVIVKDLL